MKEYKTSEASRNAVNKYRFSEKAITKYNSPESTAKRKRAYTLRRFKRYGITEEYYNQMLTEQNHSCFLCTKPFDDTYSRKACIDHNHATGKVRHLLCRICNLMVGHCKDDPNLVQTSIDYLTYWNSKHGK